jgi:hypothetical protein
MASSATHGAWGPAQFVSDAGKDVSLPSAAVNDHGDAAITWRQKDLNDNQRLAVSHRVAGDWDGWALVSAPLDHSVGTRADIGLDDQGTLRAAYVATDNGAFNQVRVMTQTEGSDSYTTASMSDADAFAPSLDVNSAGAVLVSWMDVEGPESLIRTRRLATPGGVWGPVKDAAPLDFYEAETDTAISDNGFGTVAFVRDFGGDWRVSATKVQADGFVGSPSVVSPAAADATAIDLDQNDGGTAVVSWVVDGAEIGYATRKQTADWEAHEINSPVAAPTAPRSAIAENGNILVGYAGNGHLLASYTTKSFLPLATSDSGDLDIVGGSTLAGMDDQGNAFLGAIRGLNPGEGEVRGAFLDNGGPTATTAALAAQQLATKFTVSWSATDRLSSVTTASVRMRSAAWNGAFGGYTYPLLDSSAKSFAFAGAPGHTYCFSTQAEDNVGNLSAWSGERCTTVPLDDRAMHRKGFKAIAGSAYYLGTAVKAKKKGAKLTLAGVKAKSLSLVVAKAHKGGKIRVTFAGKVLGTYSLKGTGTKKLVALKTFGATTTGTLVVKVVSKTGKTVRIDGVVVGK